MSYTVSTELPHYHRNEEVANDKAHPFLLMVCLFLQNAADNLVHVCEINRRYPCLFLAEGSPPRCLAEHPLQQVIQRPFPRGCVQESLPHLCILTVVSDVPDKVFDENSQMPQMLKQVVRSERIPLMPILVQLLDSLE